MRSFVVLICISLILSGGSIAFGQATDANLVGTILDPTGAAIPGATVELDNPATGVRRTAQSDADGLYRFWNVLVGEYQLRVTAPGFSGKTAGRVDIELNRTTTLNVSLELGLVTSEVTVVESPSQIDATSATIGETFGTRMAAYSPNTDLAFGVLNLSLLGAGVGSSGGTGVGEGPSIGGQRPRNNNFMIEGVDNNRKDVTGPTVEVSNESVAEFTLLQNQFSAEFGRATGGQFNTVLKGGTNDVHGSLYEYFSNRHLNAVDEANARRGIRENPRLDDNRFGGTVGGPIIRNKLFYFGSYEYNPIGEASAPGSPFKAPTAEGYRALGQIPGLSRTNLDVLEQYLPAAPAADQTATVQGQEIPIGFLPLNVPTFQNNHNWVTSVDYTVSETDQIRLRYIDDRADAVDPETAPDLPVFADDRTTRNKLASFSEFHAFSPTLFNEFRLGYNRWSDDISAGSFEFPGLDVFPNITIREDLNLQLGPYAQAPQGGTVNTYHLVNNMTWVKGRHTLKFGVDARRVISTDFFIQRVRGEYNYSNLERYLLDLNPDVQAERNTGGAPYHGNSTEFHWFVNDEVRLRRNLTLNLGVRYEYKGIPFSDKEQTLNAIASVPGVLVFDEPQAQTTNFVPRIGLAYSPGDSAKTVLRAGFGLSYDSYFTNLGLLARPPQLGNAIRVSPTEDIPGFLAGGGIRPDQRPEELDAATARARTSFFINDQLLPYSIQWNFGIERVIAEDYTLNVRYLGTRGVHLFTQRIMPLLARADAQQTLPTFLTRPSQSELDSLPLTLEGLESRPFMLQSFADAGFGPGVFDFPNRGNSTYHGLATELKRRFSNGLQFLGAYTWSRNIDDSTADLASTLLSPRRAQDFQLMTAERSKSFLDHTHRLTFSMYYEAPWLRNRSNWVVANLVGNWIFSGTYTAESAQYATAQSGLDSNLNLDTAGDRTVVNPAGDARLGSDVTPLTNSAGQTVGYLADNPNAGYIKAGKGVHPNGGRQTIPLNGINNFDVSVTKRFEIREGKSLEIRGAFYNALNHPQYLPGVLSDVRAQPSAATNINLIPGVPQFQQHHQVYDSHAREVHLAVRFTF